MTKYMKDDYENHRLNLEKAVRERKGPKLKNEPVCDFCGGDPKWVYAASRMSAETGNLPVVNWRWCACVECSTAIDNNDRATLEQRVEDRLKTLAPAWLFGRPLLLRRTVQFALGEFYTYAMREE